MSRQTAFETARFTDSYRGESTEDRAEVIRVDTDDDSEAHVLLIADGVGGRPQGGAAANRAVHLTRDALVAGAGWERFRRSLRSADNWYELVRFVDDMVSEDDAAGETTLLAACVTTTRIWGASVGDSEAWWVGPNTIVNLTENQVRKPFLGSGACVPTPFVFLLPPGETGTLLLATDGLFKYADADRICETVRASEPAGDAVGETARAVGELARSSSGAFHDDIAVIVCRRHPEPDAIETSAPGLWERLRGLLARP